MIARAEKVGEEAAWVAGHTQRVDHYTGFTPDGRISDELVYMVRCSVTRSSGAASLSSRSVFTRIRYRRFRDGGEHRRSSIPSRKPVGRQREKIEAVSRDNKADRPMV